MIIASLPTIPRRTESLRIVLQRILNEQTVPIDQLHVWLNGYTHIGDLPEDSRVVYHVEPTNPGPWIRYKAAQHLTDSDVFVTLDDDVVYPRDYLEVGFAHLSSTESKIISFSGLLWDPFVHGFRYGGYRWQYNAGDSLRFSKRVALLMGQTGFFGGAVARDLIDQRLPGFRTNDDMMVGLRLQEKGIRITCCPKPEGWITSLPDASAPHALFRRDAQTRHDTFSKMISLYGFDPTAGILAQFLKKEKRIVLIAPLQDQEHAVKLLESECKVLDDESTGLHVLATASASESTAAQTMINLPYTIHPVYLPDYAGRFNSLPGVMAWRRRRVDAMRKAALRERVTCVLTGLKPTHIYQYHEQRLLTLSPASLIQRAAFELPASFQQ